MARATTRYVPYLFMRERPAELLAAHPWELRLPYVAFMQRHQSRWSRLWEDGDGQTLTAFDFRYLLRDTFVVADGSEEQRLLETAGATLAEQLNSAEADSSEALAVADSSGLMPGWPGWGAGDARIPLFVAAHNYDAWNYHQHVWEEMRGVPVAFTAVPEPDVNLLNDWLFHRYRFPRTPQRFTAAVAELLDSAGKWSRTPKVMVAEGMRDGLANSAKLISRMNPGA